MITYSIDWSVHILFSIVGTSQQSHIGECAEIQSNRSFIGPWDQLMIDQCISLDSAFVVCLSLLEHPRHQIFEIVQSMRAYDFLKDYWNEVLIANAFDLSVHYIFVWHCCEIPTITLFRMCGL